MREITQKEQDYLTEVLAHDPPSQKELRKAAAILRNCALTSTQPHSLFYRWKEHAGHRYCVNAKSVFLFTDLLDAYFFMTGPLRWNPMKIESAFISECSLREAVAAAKDFGKNNLIINFKLDPGEKFFMYKTATGELTIGMRG